MAPAGVAVITGDKVKLNAHVRVSHTSLQGDVDLEHFAGLSHPHIERHGCFSMSINYHALEVSVRPCMHSLQHLVTT